MLTHERVHLEQLQAEFSQRRKRNPRYTLRAFARQLGISHSLLSMMFGGQRRLSRRTMQKIEAALPRPPEGETADDSHRLSLDQFEALSDWTHYAILSLLELPDSRL